MSQFPIGMAANKLLPSVITGNTVVVKPSPYTPLATVMLSEMAAEAFPAGVMNIMTGGDELGQMMVEHPKIAQISFTGSAATGKKIMATGAATLKKVTLELGGNDPALILPDADVSDVADVAERPETRKFGDVAGYWANSAALTVAAASTGD